ncbi:hypothetical protein TSMEX_003464 [Taenia solium]|eukprot:TsM_001229500 transcript=TsM_001229500 gene=TsM_001229500
MANGEDWTRRTSKKRPRGGVIVTQASTLPTGYRLITPSRLPLTSTNTVASMTPGVGASVVTSASRTQLNFVQVVSTAPSTSSVQGLRPRPLVPQPLRANQSITVSGTGAPSLISIAPCPVVRPPPLRPLLATATVTEAATKLHKVDIEIFNLLKELRHLESLLAELNACVKEKEAAVARCGRSTVNPYSLNSYSTSILARLNRTAKAATASNQRSKGRQFLPSHGSMSAAIAGDLTSTRCLSIPKSLQKTIEGVMLSQNERYRCRGGLRSTGVARRSANQRKYKGGA